MRVLLDISRTVARARLPAATGIDRVERAYIEWALARGDAGFLARVDRLVFLLGPDAPRALLDWFDARAVSVGPVSSRPVSSHTAPRMDMLAWFQPQRDPALRRAQSLVRRLSLARAPERALADMLRGTGWTNGAYLNVGHDNLRPVGFRAIGQAGLGRAVLLHDTIPLDHPDHARKGTVAPFREKFRVALGGEALIANSAHTAGRIAAHGAAVPQVGPPVTPPVTVLPLGIEPVEVVPSSPPAILPQGVAPASFITLGTIEPRKNHIMLLHLWQQLTSDLGDAAPHLHIIGRRGWENAEVFRILDTDPMMGRTVHEHGALDDHAARALMAGARALLFPSLAEGFGLPLGEALAAGVPVLASDIAALRELGGDVPDWLAPTDAAQWRAAILDHADPSAPRRAAQITRLAQWRAPTWAAHFEGLENLLETNMVQGGRRGGKSANRQ